MTPDTVYGNMAQSTGNSLTRLPSIAATWPIRQLAKRDKTMTQETVLQAADATVQEFDWGELVWYANGKMGNSATMTFGRAVLKAGHENFRHSHPNCEEILHVLSGRIVHSLEDELFPMGPGDTIVIPANVVHNASNDGDDVAIMTIMFSTPDRQTVVAEE